jgi:hypothetical protein
MPGRAEKEAALSYIWLSVDYSKLYAGSIRFASLSLHHL